MSLIIQLNDKFNRKDQGIFSPILATLQGNVAEHDRRQHNLALPNGVRQRTAETATLVTVNSATSLVLTLAASKITDRFGRKMVMAVSRAQS